MATHVTTVKVLLEHAQVVDFQVVPTVGHRNSLDATNTSFQVLQGLDNRAKYLHVNIVPASLREYWLRPKCEGGGR